MLYVQPLRFSDAYCQQAFQIFESVAGVSARHDIATPRRLIVTDDAVLVTDLVLSH